MSDKVTHRKILRLQQQILRSLRADVRKHLGLQSPEIKKYYKSYKTEFSKPYTVSDKDELLSRLLGSDIVLIGDYHTFRRSQITFLKLTELLQTKKNSKEITFALEAFESRFQNVVDLYLENKISEADFLEKTQYEATWGFPWKHYKPILEYAKKHKIEVIALNDHVTELKNRDTHAAVILADYTMRKPSKRILTLFGDLHLARCHLPRHLKNEIKKRKISKRVLTLFQNSETLFWKLTSNKEITHAEIVKMDRCRYVIMNATPWMKLQSYLDWSEKKQTQDPRLDDYADEGSTHDHTEGDSQLLLEKLTHQISHLCKAFELECPSFDTMNIFSFHDLFNSQTDRYSTFTREMDTVTAKFAKLHIFSNRSFYLSKRQLAYVPLDSINALPEIAGQMLFHFTSSTKTDFTFSNHDFLRAIYFYAMTYFSSKILNPRRKCDTEESLQKVLLYRTNSQFLYEELLHKKAAKIALKHLKQQKVFLKSKRKSALAAKVYGSNPSFSVFLNAARIAGYRTGDRLFTKTLTEKISIEKLKELFTVDISSEKQCIEALAKLVHLLGARAFDHDFTTSTYF